MATKRSYVIAAIAVLVALVLVLLVASLLRTSSDTSTEGAQPVVLESVGASGPAPFTNSVSSSPATDSAGDDVVVSRTTVGDIEQADGATPGLYGGTGASDACDVGQLIEFLANNPDKSTAFASAAQIPASDLPTYLSQLLPVVLVTDTWVTNHGYESGQATPFQAVLEAGTAVLIDNTGAPRVRCACGNPLLAPDGLAGSEVDLTGTPWDGFTIGSSQFIEPAPTALTSIQLRPPNGGELVSVPFATETSDQDIASCGELQGRDGSQLAVIPVRGFGQPAPCEALFSLAQQYFTVPATELSGSAGYWTTGEWECAIEAAGNRSPRDAVGGCTSRDGDRRIEFYPIP